MAPSRSSAIETAKCGMPWRKLVVPSSGSTIHRWLLSVPARGAAFLAEKAVIRPRLGEFLVDDFLGAAVGGGDEIARALERDLQVLDLAEIALEALAGPIGGLGHDVEDGGMLHGACGTFRGAFTQGRRCFVILPREAGKGDRASARWKGRQRSRPASAPHAPSTMLRVVPLPRAASRGRIGELVLATLSCARALLHHDHDAK